MAVLVWCSKSIKFNSICQSIVELNLGSTHSVSSESDVMPVLLQSPSCSVRFGSWKVRCLNQVLHTRCLELDVEWPVHCSGLIFAIGKYDDNHPSFHAGCVVICYTIDLKDRFEYHSAQGKLRHYLSMTNKAGHHVTYGGHFTESCRVKAFTHFLFLDECRSNNL